MKPRRIIAAFAAGLLLAFLYDGMRRALAHPAMHRALRAWSRIFDTRMVRDREAE